MTHIKQFVAETTIDLRRGRHSWRVLMMLWSVALMISVAATLLHR